MEAGEFKEINREGTFVSLCVYNGVHVILSAALFPEAERTAVWSGAMNGLNALITATCVCVREVRVTARMQRVTVILGGKKRDPVFPFSLPIHK